MSLDSYRFIIECDERSQENRIVQELMGKMLDISPEINLRQEKSSQNTLDLGSVIVAVIGTPFAIEAVRVLGSWLMKHPEGEITIEKTRQNGVSTTKIRAKGLTDDQLERQLKNALK